MPTVKCLSRIACRASNARSAYSTIQRREADIDRGARGEELASPLHKAMSGTLISTAIKGDDLLERWKSRLVLSRFARTGDGAASSPVLPHLGSAASPGGATRNCGCDR